MNSPVTVLHIILLLSTLSLTPAFAAFSDSPPVLEAQAATVVYAGEETMHFSLSWSGGINIGDLRLHLSPPIDGRQVLTARVTDGGLFSAVYPANDTFVTSLRRPFGLPERYEVEQIERGKTVRRLTAYNQRLFAVISRKNDSPPEAFHLAGTVYNEFSAFFITRALRLETGQQQYIPVFADKKRHLVPVRVLGREAKKTQFGTLRTIKVRPEMRFKGLYDKDSETVFWLTDDVCRVPVEIRSKILIGSLVAQLVEYSSPACRMRLKQ